MASTFSTNLALELIGTGDQAGTWGITTNTNLGTLIEQAISGYVTQAVATGTDTTITIPDGATGVARNMYIELTGTGGASTNLIVPANKKLYFIFNNSTGAVTVKVSGQTGVSVPAGKKMVLVSNGTDIVDATNYLANLSAASANITVLTSASATITNLLATSLTVSGNTFLATSSGNVGIGTSSPATKLQIGDGSSGSVKLRIHRGSGTDYSEFWNDTGTTVIDTVGGGNLDLRMGNSSKATLTAGGNLGIGTSSPSYQLDVVGGTRVAETAAGNGYEVAAGSTNILTSYNRTTSTWLPLRQRANQHEFYCDGVETLRLTPTGNLGLGVTPSAWNTYKALEIGRVGNYFAGYSGGTELTLGANAYYSTGWKYAVTGALATRYMTDNSGGHYWFTAPSGTAGNAITFTQAMTLDASGNLGVGTVDIQASGSGSTLQLQNRLRLYNSAVDGTTNAVIGTIDAQTRNFGAGIATASYSAIKFCTDSSTYYYGDIRFFTNNTDSTANAATERARITSGGDLLVGRTTTLNTKFLVEGQVAIGSAGAGGNGIYLYVSGALSDNSYLSRASAGTGTTTWYIGNQAITTSSDARLKDNIKPTERNAVELLSQWEIVDHTWNDPSDQCENNRNSRGVWTGVVAQQVQSITPWLVNKPLEDVNEDGSINPWTMDFGYAVPLLVKAIQEQQAMIKSLEAKVAALEAK